jgi:hypothetical protein
LLARSASALEKFIRALAVAPPALPPKASEAVWQDDPRGTSGVIIVGTIAMSGPDGAATRSFPDKGEHDKAGDESRHHPQ